MASLSLPKHSMSFAFHTQTPKTHLSHNLSILSKSTQSHFCGLQLSYPSSSSLPLTSYSSKSLTIVAAKVTEGSLAPAFNLKDQDGKSVSLSKFKGKPVIVYFYPADETPGCTKQACAFRDSYEKFKKAGAEVVGISGDDVSSHKSFKQKYKLPFTLLSDEGNRVRKEWGVPSDLFGALPGRQPMFLTAMESCDWFTTINSSRRSILMRPSSFFKAFEHSHSVNPSTLYRYNLVRSYV